MEDKEAAASTYDILKATDIVQTLMELFQKYNYKLRDRDGKIEGSLSQAIDTPWIHIKPAVNSDGKQFDCYRWHKILFNMVSLKSKAPFVPSRCHQCWKVVVRPQTLEQLFDVEVMMRMMNRASKCGLELRDRVFGHYGGYWYNESMEEGRECYQAAAEEMKKRPLLAPLLDKVDENGRTMWLMLKRGCTEFEHAVGDSLHWKITPEQMQVESLVNYYVVGDDMIRQQPEHLQRHVHRRWIEYAFENADETVYKYTNGEPLYPAYRTYHQPELLPEQPEEE